ncbi:MAG TPA: hypothetical protein VEA16_22680, partial [Vicinamibacterales bacterium]|nr:hypothetical protein [Vicinamibacterales bacterium]
DVIIARDVSWARFYQAQSAVAAIEVPMLLNGVRIHMGTIPIALVAIAIVLGFRRRHPEVMLIVGAAAGTLAFIANLWGDVVGFITPVCVQLWPLAALGLQWVVRAVPPPPRLRWASGPSVQVGRLTAAGLVALIVPVANFVSNRPKIEPLRTAGEGPGIRALYSSLPPRSAVVAENYWLARLINYMHFSGEVTPDPNPRVLDNDAGDVRAALTDGLEVYAFEGATHWLNAQGFRFERTAVAEEPFERWISRQPEGTLIAAAAAGRSLPFEWLPFASRSQSNRPANYGAMVWSLGSPPIVEQHDAGVATSGVVGADGRALTVTSGDEGPHIQWGDDVVAAVDRGLAVAAFNPDGVLIGQWMFSPDDRPGVQLPPTPYVLRGQRRCEILRPGQPRDVTRILGDGIWLATVEGTNTGRIGIATAAGPAQWRHRLAAGRGEAAIDGTTLLLTPTQATRPVFRFSMPPSPERVVATLETDSFNAVRVCEAGIQELPPSGAFEITADRDGWFGAGWHLAERGGTQRFRWSERRSTLLWRMNRQAHVRLMLRMRAASKDGATVQAAINGAELPACTLPAGAWTDCPFVIDEAAIQTGINQLTLTADTVSPAADRPGDARELSFVMQASRVRIGQ